MTGRRWIILILFLIMTGIATTLGIVVFTINAEPSWAYTAGIAGGIVLGVLSSLVGASAQRYE